MTSHYRHLRSFDPAQGFPLQVEPGEIIVNTANRQIAVGDADAMSVGVPKLLIAVRFFDATAQYAINDIVAQNGNVYRANSSIPPGAFNAANWTQLGAGTAGSIAFTPVGSVAATDVQAAIAEVASDYAAADATIVTNYQAADNTKVAKSGDTMTGPLFLPQGTAANPGLNFTGSFNSGVYASPTTLQFSVGGVLKGQLSNNSLRVPDGTFGSPGFTFLNEPASGLLRKASSSVSFSINTVEVMNWSATAITCFFPLALPADPTTALQAATKQYVDGKAPVAATAAEYISNSAPTKILTPGAAWAAAALLNLGPMANITFDFGAGLDFYVTLNGVGTVNNPANPKNGQKGVIYILQDATGSRTITTWGSKWKFPGGAKPVLSTAPNSIDAISYAVLDANTFIACAFSAGFA